MRETLPTLALRLGARLDLLRKIVRTTPALKALGERLGPSRVYGPQDAEVIKKAWEAKAKA